MLGMEMMLANLIGLKPDEMKQIFEGLLTDAQKALAAIERIEANQTAIIERLERLENVGSANNS